MKSKSPIWSISHLITVLRDLWSAICQENIDGHRLPIRQRIPIILVLLGVVIFGLWSFLH